MNKLSKNFLVILFLSLFYFSANHSYCENRASKLGVEISESQVSQSEKSVEQTTVGIDEDTISIFEAFLKKHDKFQIKKIVNEYLDSTEYIQDQELRILTTVIDYVKKNEDDTVIFSILAEVMDRIVTERPSSFRAKRMQAAVHTGGRNPEIGLGLYRKYALENPENYFVWWPPIYFYVAVGDIDHAVAYLDTIGIYFPDSLLVPMNQMKLESDRKEFDKALIYAEIGLKLAKKQNDKLNQLVFLENMAISYFELKMAKESDSIFEYLILNDSKNSLIFNNYAYFLSERGEKLKYALELSKKSIEMDQNNEYYVDTYAWILYKLGRYEEALAYIKKALEIGLKKNANSYLIFEHFADISFRLGKLDIAYSTWKIIDDAGQGSKYLKQKIKYKKIYE